MTRALTAAQRARYRRHHTALCLDCLADVERIGETFMLHDELWLRIVPGGRGHLCVGCVEQRLGRRLTRNDFNGQPFGWTGQSERLNNRQEK